MTPLPVPSIPPLNASTGRVLERLADGSIVVGGDFTYVNGNPISYLTKFDADGQLQTGWRPEPTGVVYALASSGEHVYIAGSFQSVGGQAIARLARVRADTGQIDPQWAPVVNATVRHLAPDGNGGLIAAGDFGTVDGVPRLRLARIVIETGSLDTSWQHTLQLQAPTALLVSGTNLFVADQGNVYKLSLATGINDTTWTVNNPNASAVVALAERQGFLYVGGAFTQLKVGGAVPANRNRLARVNLTSPYTLDTTWNPDANGPVNAIAFDANEAVYIVGEFSTVGGAARGQIAKLASTGTGAPTTPFVFNNTFFRQFYDVLVTSNQLYVTGGRFLLDFGVPDRRFGMAAFNLSNAQLSTRLYDLGTRGSISAIARQPDGAYIVGGSFQKAGTRERLNLFRQLASGELDLGWNPSPSAEIRAVAATDSHVFVGGTFGTIGGVQRFSLAKIDSFGVGVVDTTWTPPQEIQSNLGYPQIMKIDATRQMLMVGLTEGLVRIPLSGNGQPVPNWNALANASIVALDIAPDGVIYAGGDGGSPGNHLRRYFPNASGPSAQDGSWQPRPSNPVGAVHVGRRVDLCGRRVLQYWATASLPGRPAIGYQPRARRPDLGSARQHRHRAGSPGYRLLRAGPCVSRRQLHRTRGAFGARPGASIRDRRRCTGYAVAPEHQSGQRFVASALRRRTRRYRRIRQDREHDAPWRVRPLPKHARRRDLLRRLRVAVFPNPQ